MTTLDHTPSLHIGRVRSDPVYRTPFGKVVIALVAACPKLRPFKGVLLQYLAAMDLSIKSEGLHAVLRYKAYRATLLDVISSKEVPSRKYRHALPIYRIALANLDDAFCLQCIHTVMRFYDSHLPPRSLQERELHQFEESFMTENYDELDRSRSVQLFDDLIDFEDLILSINTDQDFQHFKNAVILNEPYRPVEKAILLSKKGTASFDQSKQPAIRGFAPSIVGSTAELAEGINTPIYGERSYNDLLSDLGNVLGSLSFPSMKVTTLKPPLGYLNAQLRRNVVFGAPGFKSRVIAVADYQTQYMLQPIHDWIFKVLSRLASDYTFDHDRGFRRLSEFTRTSSFVACFDLSNATDAFPVSFTELVLKHLLPGGQTVAPLWRAVMTILPFKGKWYKRGQPMGLLSSWAAFAISHHYVVWISAFLAGRPVFRQVMRNPDNFYGIVGDDVFITHAAVAHYYSLIMNALGVKINLTKSLVVTSDKRVSEFVKRNSFNGEEISAISPTLIIKSFGDYALARELILKLRDSSVKTEESSASTIDFESTVDLYRSMGSHYMRTAISTMCTIPTEYAGLAPMEQRAQWPPQIRFQFLMLKSLKLLEFTIRSYFIGSNGQDTYTDLVRWIHEEIVETGKFTSTSFYEFTQRLSLDAFATFGPKSLKTGKIIYGLELIANALERGCSEEEFSLLEDDMLIMLSAFVRVQSLSVKEIDRVLTRSYAHRVFKVAKSPVQSFTEYRTVFDNYIQILYDRYTLKDTSSRKSREDFYANLFANE